MYKSGLIPFIVDKENSFMLEFSKNIIRFYAKHGILISNNVDYEISSPYNLDELFENGIFKIRYVQNGDILYLFHPNHPIMALTRYANDNWVLSEFEIKNGAWGNISPVNAEITLSGTTGDITATSTASIFSATDVGRLIRLTIKESNTTSWEAGKSVSADTIRYSDNKYYKALNSGTTGGVKPVHSKGSISDGGVQWEYIHSGYAVFKIKSFTNGTTVVLNAVGDEEVPAEFVSKGTDYYELGLIHKGSEYPFCGAFFRNRFCFMINVKGVPYVCLSCSDDYDNFADKEHGEVLATNAITIQVVSNKYNKGCWLSPASVLFVGTTTGEFYIDSASSGEAFAPDNSKIQQISAVGSLPIQPVRVGSHTLFVTASGTSVRDIVYSYSTDTYDPIEVSLFGKHLLTSGITGVAYQEYPDKIVWFTVNDGRLIGMTFMSEQNVQAVHQHYLGGDVENIAVIPNPEYNIDDLWLVIKREDMRSIEWLDNGYVVQYPDEINNILDTDEKEIKESDYMKKTAFYLDGGLSLVRNPYNGFSGYVYAVSSNMYNREILLYDENDSSVVIRRYLLASDNNLLFACNNYEDNRCTYVAEVPYSSGDSPDYTINVGAALLGKIIEIVQVYNDNGLQKEKVISAREINFYSLEFSLDTSLDTLSVKIKITDVFNNDDIYINGLGHLEGKEVAIMVDGAFLGTQVVENGSVTVPNKSKDISVGLPIDSVYIPQRMYVQGGSGSGVGDVQRIDHVTFMLWRTGGGEVGQKFSTLQPIYFRETDATMGESAPLYTGNKTIAVDCNTSTIKEKGAQLIVRNKSVFPMNILAIAPHFSTSGNGL